MDAAPHSHSSATPTATGSRPLQTALLGAALAAVGFGVQTLGDGAPPSPASVGVARSAAPPAPPVDAPLPELLSETGLYEAGSTTRIARENMFYVPQYPLWSDGATKRRWISLPKGTRIDASKPDAWEFPVGTRFWKEFSFGERTETRYLERLSDGSYRYATYVWNSAKGDAVRAPNAGVHGVVEIQKGIRHDVPSTDDCLACHEGRKSSPVLGFGALQLSSDRDPLAPHREPIPDGAVDLAELLRRDLLANAPPALTARAPRIDAPSPTARAAAGYLFGNCSGCHNSEGSLAAVGLDFDQSVLQPRSYERLTEVTVGQASRFRLPGEDASLRIAAGDPQHSAVYFRMSSRDAAAQMPPLATKLVDTEATRLIRRFIAEDSSPTQQRKVRTP